MKLVHFSDLHLGFRQYDRQTPAGVNQREADVAATLRTVIDKVIEIRPEIVLIGGDIFHTVRPTNTAIVYAFNQFSRLTQDLPQCTIVMVAGNHDTPRTAESGSILRLFSTLGIKIVERTAKRFRVGDVSILGVPDMDGSFPQLELDPDAKYNLLVMHGEVEGVVPRHTDRPSTAISERTLAAAKWDYIGLGHYHVYRSVLPNAFYSGSIDYTSSNPWGELVEEREAGIGKGIIEHDLETGAHTFHQLPPARLWADLPAISGVGLSPADLDATIQERVQQCEGGIEGKIVRLVVRDCPLHILRDLDHKALREFKRKALNFNLDTRRPELIRPEPGQARAAQRSRPSLADLLRGKLEERALAGHIDRPTLIALGLHYLDEANGVAAPEEES